MKIQDGRIEKLTKDEIVESMEEYFLDNSDSLTSVKKDGILESIFNITADTEDNAQNLLAYIAEAANPLSAEGIWQDALYGRIGVQRFAPEKASFTITFEGSPNKKVGEQAIIINDVNSNYEFTNTNSFLFDSEGYAQVEMHSVKSEYIRVNEESFFKIVRAPIEVNSLDNSSISNVFAGRNRETDEEYRLRFKSSKALYAKATHRANYANLNKYVDDLSFLDIVDKNTDISMNPFYVKVIAKHNTTDQIFAEAIFDTFGSGIVFQGDTTITLKDLTDNDVVIKFQNAEIVPVSLYLEVVLKSGYEENSTFQNIREAIISYVNARNFGLGSAIYANEFIVPVHEIDGVEAVLETKVKISSEAVYTDIINLNRYEVPQFTEANILIEGA